MVWHIFKKDLRLMWRMALAVALVHLAAPAILIKLAQLGNNSGLGSLVDLIQMVGIFGTAILIVATVQQDAIPGMRQDWLARPVKRTDLLLSKIVFVAIIVQGPILLGDLMECLALGFSLQSSLAAAVSRNLWMLLAIDLPLMAFGTLTKNLAEAVVGGLVITVTVSGLIATLNQLDGGARWQETLRTGVAWITQSITILLVLLVTAIVLGFQYYRRKTTPARWTTGLACFLFVASLSMPWRPVFAVQQRFSKNPAAVRSVAIAFEPSLGKFRDPSGMRRSDRNENETIAVALPLRFSGLPANAVLKMDHSTVRLTGVGAVAKDLATFSDLEIRKGSLSAEPVTDYQSIRFRSEDYNRIKDQQTSIEIDYSLTLLTLAASHGIPAAHGEQRTPDLGWCRTRVNSAGTAAQLICLAPGQIKGCATAFLEHLPTAIRNPERSNCYPDYSRYWAQFQLDAIGRIGFSLPFRDAAGLARYPIEGSKIGESQIVVRIYKAQDHFTRRIVIPEIRLSDWAVGI